MEADRAGFTLLEVITVLAIIAILSATAAIGLAGRMALARADTAENHLYRTLVFARQSAVLRGIPVIFCALADGSCIARGGREMAALAAGPGGGQGVVLQRVGLADTKAWLEFRGALGAPQLRFAPDGTVAGAGSWIYCPGNRRKTLRRRVVVNQAGRIYPAGDRDGDGQKDGTEGEAFCRQVPP